MTKCERCDKPGQLREGCNNVHFEKQRVLCDEHYTDSKEFHDAPCGICGSPRRSCCC